MSAIVLALTTGSLGVALAAGRDADRSARFLRVG